MLAGSRCPGIGPGSDLHSHKAGKTGEESPGNKGKRHKPGKIAKSRHSKKYDEHTCEKADQYPVLPPEISHRPMVNRR